VALIVVGVAATTLAFHNFRLPPSPLLFHPYHYMAGVLAEGRPPPDVSTRVHGSLAGALGDRGTRFLDRAGASGKNDYVTGVALILALGNIGAGRAELRRESSL
jgi:hypothetical protein